MKKKLVILTGNEIRHKYFKLRLSLDKRFKVLASYCEGTEQSLTKSIQLNPKTSQLEKLHVEARTQSEIDFFLSYINSCKDLSKSKFIKKGEINNIRIVAQILKLNPDLLICYGSSLIKSELLTHFKGKFLNVHLGLSPYYRGTGTNVWPLINNEPEFVGATFMYIDSGIDTGSIIHQIRADIMLGDSPHSIGNRLIKKMTEEYCKIIDKFDNLHTERQIFSKGKIYYLKDFNSNTCKKLYSNIQNGLIENYLEKKKILKLPKIIKNKGLN